MPRKKVDERILTLIHHSVNTHQRCLLVLVGDRGRDQIPNLYAARARFRNANPVVCWCYKKDLGFTTHRLKKLRWIKRKQTRGNYDYTTEDPFWHFQQSSDVRYCKYKESQKLLGNTFDICILQDFEALTPNLMCQTTETVAGGGLVIILMRTMASLKQLYSLTFDAHEHFKTNLSSVIRPRFCERMMLSMADCNNCLVLDDELNILPISRSKLDTISRLQPFRADSLSSDLRDYRVASRNNVQLTELRNQFSEHKIIGTILNLCVTIDQAAVVAKIGTYVNIEDSGIQEPSSAVKRVYAITAARGRGKSAALGLGIAMAIAGGVKNIQVCAPSPENVNVVFQFIILGLKALGLQEGTHFLKELFVPPIATDGAQEAAFAHVFESEQLRKVVTKITVMRDCDGNQELARQVIEYKFPFQLMDDLQPGSALSSRPLLILDEVAAIPLGKVRRFLSHFPLSIMATTIDGYEGSGHALSRNLFAELQRGVMITQEDENITYEFQRSSMNEPIRYAAHDPIEKWLREILCLGPFQPAIGDTTKITPPETCRLYRLNRNALFSYHPKSEKILSQIMGLWDAFNYKNTPDDLLKLCDSPTHEVYILTDNLENTQLRNIYAAVEVSYEGQIALKELVDLESTSIDNANEISWTISQYFPESNFSLLTGMRILRFGVHESLQKRGYGRKTVLDLVDFVSKSRDIKPCLDESQADDLHWQETTTLDTFVPDKSGNASETLLQDLVKSVPAFQPAYIALMFGLEEPIFDFWTRCGFVATYISQECLETTNLYPLIMMKELATLQIERWIDRFAANFGRRFTFWITQSYRSVPQSLLGKILAYGSQVLVNGADNNEGFKSNISLDQERVDILFTDAAKSRLKLLTEVSLNADSLSHIIYAHGDLIHILAFLYFRGAFGSLKLSNAQSALLVGVGLQRRTGETITHYYTAFVWLVEMIRSDMGLELNDAVGLFRDMIKRLYEGISFCGNTKVREVIESAKRKRRKKS